MPAEQLPVVPDVAPQLRPDGTIPAPNEHRAQREFWTGQPVELETVWTLLKSGKVARLVLLTHQLGWELRVESGDLLLTQVCRSDREIEDVSAAWREAMLEKGWHSA